MLEDYESGTRRKPSRHVVGRMRWLLLASLVINFFLFYKYWIHGTTIVILEQKTKRINSDLVTERKQIEHYKKQTMMTEERRTNCEKRLSEIDDKSSECQLRHKACSDTLETTSAKLLEMNQNVKSLTEVKEIMEIDLEKKTTELESVKEQVLQLQSEVEQYQRNQNNPSVKVQKSPIVRQTPEAAQHEEDEIQKVQSDEPKNQENVEEREREIHKGEIQNINSINTPMQKSVEKQHEEKRDAEDGVIDADKSDNVAMPSKIILKDKNLATEAAVFIECDFSEQSLDKGKCNYKMEPTDHPWEFGKPAFLQEHSTQCLYIDDMASGLGMKKSLVFQEIQTDKCLKLTLNATIVGGGQLSIHNNDKIYDVRIETTKPEVPVWKLNSFNLTPAPSHTVEIAGIVGKYGGVGLTKVLLAEGECSPDIKSEVEFDDKVDEHDKEMLDDIA